MGFPRTLLSIVAATSLLALASLAARTGAPGAFLAVAALGGAFLALARTERRRGAAPARIPAARKHPLPPKPAPNPFPAVAAFSARQEDERRAFRAADGRSRRSEPGAPAALRAVGLALGIPNLDAGSGFDATVAAWEVWIRCQVDKRAACAAMVATIVRSGISWQATGRRGTASFTALERAVLVRLWQEHGMGLPEQPAPSIRDAGAGPARETVPAAAMRKPGLPPPPPRPDPFARLMCGDPPTGCHGYA